MDKPIDLTQRAVTGEAFTRRITAESGQDVRRCYQCGKCTAGCPVAFASDVMPHQVLRFLQLGMKDEALDNRAIWLCSTCAACTTRCPNGIDLARVMDCLRVAALEEGRVDGGREVALFNHHFLDSAARFGRVHELSLAATLNLKGRRPFKDVDLGVKFLTHGKMKLMPSQAGGGVVARLVAAARQRKRKEEQR